MAAVSQTFGVGDTVYVWFKNSATLMWLPVEKVIERVDTITSGNQAVVTFTDGSSITHDSTNTRVFGTQAACAAYIIDQIIALATPCVLLDSTTSGASTAGAAATTLVRKD